MCGEIGHTALGWHGLPPCPTRGVDVDRLCTFCHRSGHLRNDCYTRRDFGATGDTAATSCFGGRTKRIESDRTRSNENWRDRDDRSRDNYGRERDNRPRGLRGAANRAGQALLPAPAAPPTNDDASAVSGLSGTSLRSWGGGRARSGRARPRPGRRARRRTASRPARQGLRTLGRRHRLGLFDAPDGQPDRAIDCSIRRH